MGADEGNDPEERLEELEQEIDEVRQRAEDTDGVPMGTDESEQESASPEGGDTESSAEEGAAGGSDDDAGGDDEQSGGG